MKGVKIYEQFRRYLETCKNANRFWKEASSFTKEASRADKERLVHI